MRRLISDFKTGLLVLAAMIAVLSCNNKRPSKSRIAEDYPPLHTIVNKELKDQLIRFNEQFKDHPAAQGRGLEIDCNYIYADSIIYSISYAAGINSSYPRLLCEPIDGKPVSLSFGCLFDEFRLDERKSIELLKDFTSNEYQIHKANMEEEGEVVVIDGDTVVLGPPELMIMFDFVGIRLVFDKENHLLRVDTLGFH